MSIAINYEGIRQTKAKKAIAIPKIPKVGFKFPTASLILGSFVAGYTYFTWKECQVSQVRWAHDMKKMGK